MPQHRHVLVVGERWREAERDGPPSNFIHNIVGSLEALDGYAVSALFTDETYLAGESVDQALVDRVAEDPPDLIFLTLLPEYPINPSPVALDLVKIKRGVPLAAMYWDTALPKQVEFADGYSDIVDVNVAIDCYTVYPAVSRAPEKWLPLWTPQDPRIFFADARARDIDVAFVGSVDTYPDRRDALAYLEANGVSVCKHGGIREGGLTIDGYADLLRRTRISLNFSKLFGRYGNHQFKGRVLESMLCGALVLEPNNRQTPRWFRAGVEYDTFGSSDELLEKIARYRDDEAARAAIADRGRRKAAETLSAKTFWDAIFDRLAENRPSALL